MGKCLKRETVNQCRLFKSLTLYFPWKVDMRAGVAVAILGHNTTLRVMLRIVQKDRYLDP